MTPTSYTIKLTTQELSLLMGDALHFLQLHSLNDGNFDCTKCRFWTFFAGGIQGDITLTQGVEFGVSEQGVRGTSGEFLVYCIGIRVPALVVNA